MLSYIFTSKISQSHWLSLSFPFCQVYDYDWGLRDDFMGEASLPLGQLAPQKWNDLVLTLSETGEHFNSIQGWLWGMSFIPKPSRVCLSKTRQQNDSKKTTIKIKLLPTIECFSEEKVTTNYNIHCPHWNSDCPFIVWIQFPGRAEYLGQLSLEVRFTPVSSAGDIEIRQIQRIKRTSWS